MSALRVVVIIPALNEEPALGSVLTALPAWVSEVIVADNGSTDDTAGVARRHGATLVEEPRRGYGAACLRALVAAGMPDVVVFIDADASDDPSEMERLVAPIRAGTADLVIGSRVLGHAAPGSMTLPQRFGNVLASALLRAIYGETCTDLGPFRAVRFTALQALLMDDLDYGWTVQMQARAMRMGLRVVEVPVSYRKRIGRSKISGTVRGVVGAGTKILWTIAREAALAGQGRGGRVHAPALPALSVIIPTLNEAANLPETLAALGHTADLEIIVVDGGSTDDTAAIAEAAGARVLHSERGRAQQMNAGAQAARFDTLLFLHADTRVPFGYRHHIERVLSGPGVVAGAFRLAFDDTRPSLRLIERVARFRSRRLQAPYGDQGLFMRRDVFEAAGGFPSVPILEDWLLVKALRSRGKIVLAPAAAITSARRWKRNGVLRTTARHWMILIAHACGVRVETLASWRESGAPSARRLR